MIVTRLPTREGAKTLSRAQISKGIGAAAMPINVLRPSQRGSNKNLIIVLVTFGALALIIVLTFLWFRLNAVRKESSDHSDRGDAYAKQRQYTEAEMEYRQAVLLANDNARAHAGLADIYLQMGRYSESAAECRVTFALVPNAPEVYDILGEDYAKQKRYPDAEQAFKQAIQQDPKQDAYHTHLGATYFKEKQYDAAIQEMQAALKINPNSEVVQKDLEAAERARDKQ